MDISRQTTGSTRGGELGAILDRLSANILRESPETATTLAVSEAQAGGRYVDRLSDLFASKACAAYVVFGKPLWPNSADLDRGAFYGQDAVTYDVVTTSLRNQIHSANFETGGGASAPYTVTQLTGAYTFIPDFLATQHPVTHREEANAYLTRLANYARVVDQETARIGEDAAAGVIQPNFTIDGAVRQLSEFAATAPAQTVLVSSLQSRLASVTEIAKLRKNSVDTTGGSHCAR